MAGDIEDVAAISAADEVEDAAEVAKAEKAAKIVKAKAAKAAKAKAAKAAIGDNKKPGPPASVSKPPKVEAKADAVEVVECTKSEAWDTTIDHKSPAVTDDDFTKVWTQSVKDQMTTGEVSDEDELTGADWAAIKERIAGEVCIPF